MQAEVTSLLKDLRSGFIYHCRPRSPASWKTSGQVLFIIAGRGHQPPERPQVRFYLSLQAEVTSLLKDLRLGFIIAGRGHQPPERPQVRFYSSLQAEVISLLKDLRSGFIIAGRGHQPPERPQVTICHCRRRSPASWNTSGQDFLLQAEVTSLLKDLRSGFIIAGRGHQPPERPQVRIYHCRPRSSASWKTSGQDLSLQAEVTTHQPPQRPQVRIYHCRSRSPASWKSSSQDLSLQAEVTSLFKDLRSGFIIASRGHQPPQRPQVRIYHCRPRLPASSRPQVRIYHCRPRSPASWKTSGQDLSLQAEVTSLLKGLRSGFIYHCRPRSPASWKTSGQDLIIIADRG